MTDAAGDTAEKFMLKITGPGMNFEHEIDPTAIPTAIQLVLGGGQAAAVPPAPPWQPGADPRVDLDPPGDSAGGTKPAKKAAPRKSGGPKKTNYDVPKHVNYAPTGKESLKDFAQQKNPTTNQEKQLVVIHWLREVAGRAVTTGEVIAAFNFLKWKNPAEPANALAVTSAKKGWLDTGDMNDIKLHWQGDNYLQNELPKDASK